MSFPLRLAAATVLAAVAASPVVAQTAIAAPSPPASAAVPASNSYRSAFTGYRSFGEQPVQSWRDANDTVGRIGGRQAHARDGQSGAPEGKAMPAGHDAMGPSSGHGTAAPPTSAASRPGSSPAPSKAASGGAAPSTPSVASHAGHRAP